MHPITPENRYFRDIDFENIYIESVKNEEIMNLEFKGFMIYL
jgi:hypothetical protein